MYIVSKLDIENQKVDIIHADCKNAPDYAKLYSMQKIFDHVTILKQNRDVTMNIIDDCQVNVYAKNMLFGKDLLFIYQIIETTSETKSSHCCNYEEETTEEN